MVCHIGGAELLSGHYIAYFMQDGRWYKVDDHVVSSVPWHEVHKACERSGESNAGGGGRRSTR